jgi:hypothetical protein
MAPSVYNEQIQIEKSWLSKIDEKIDRCVQYVGSVASKSKSYMPSRWGLPSRETSRCLEIVPLRTHRWRMIIKQEINQTMCQKKSLENCKKQNALWINGSYMNWGINIRDKLLYIEAQYKIPLDNQIY